MGSSGASSIDLIRVTPIGQELKRMKEEGRGADGCGCGWGEEGGRGEGAATHWIVYAKVLVSAALSSCLQ